MIEDRWKRAVDYTISLAKIISVAQYKLVIPPLAVILDVVILLEQIHISLHWCEFIDMANAFYLYISMRPTGRIFITAGRSATYLYSLTSVVC